MVRPEQQREQALRRVRPIFRSIAALEATANCSSAGDLLTDGIWMLSFVIRSEFSTEMFACCSRGSRRASATRAAPVISGDGYQSASISGPTAPMSSVPANRRTCSAGWQIRRGGNPTSGNERTLNPRIPHPAQRGGPGGAPIIELYGLFGPLTKAKTSRLASAGRRAAVHEQASSLHPSQSTKANPCESRGRKATDLKDREQGRGYRLQGAEFRSLSPVPYNL